MNKQALVLALAVLAAASAPAHAQLRAPSSTTAAPATRGFYGGVALRESGAGTGLQLGQLPLAWGTLGATMAEDAPSRSLFFGGYRFGNDLAVEASLGTSERYALQPDATDGRRGVGLSLTPSDASSRTFNADVYTTWSVLPRFSLYGRLGYAQTDVTGNPALASLPSGDPRRGRDGMNYGLGFRYDVNRALGLRLEYARFGRFAGEIPQGGVLPDTDQVQVGVQLRF